MFRDLPRFATNARLREISPPATENLNRRNLRSGLAFRYHRRGPAFRGGRTLVRCRRRGPSAAVMIPGKPGAPSAAARVPCERWTVPEPLGKPACHRTLFPKALFFERDRPRPASVIFSGSGSGRWRPRGLGNLARPSFWTDSMSARHRRRGSGCGRRPRRGRPERSPASRMRTR